MTWAEFQIRCYGWKRKDDRESWKFRKVGFASMWSFHGDYKKLPKTEDKYWQIGEHKSTSLSENQKEAIKLAVKRYKEEINGKR